MNRHIPERLRKIVAERANYRCEYCLLPELLAFYSFQIDHIISMKHGGLTTESNLAYSCVTCNNAKGSDIGTILLPEREYIRLFNPRTDEWEANFYFDNSVIFAKTKLGEATIKVLDLNAVDRLIERSITF